MTPPREDEEGTEEGITILTGETEEGIHLQRDLLKGEIPTVEILKEEIPEEEVTTEILQNKLPHLRRVRKKIINPK